MDDKTRLEKLISAEQKGLKLAILCRTIIVGFAFLWLVFGSLSAGYWPNSLGLVALFLFTLIGVINLFVIGTKSDRWWLKYLIYTIDILGVCALFAFFPSVAGRKYHKF